MEFTWYRLVAKADFEDGTTETYETEAGSLEYDEAQSYLSDIGSNKPKHFAFLKFVCYKMLGEMHHYNTGVPLNPKNFRFELREERHSYRS